MKELLEKVRGLRAGTWLTLLLLLAAAGLLLPAFRETEPAMTEEEQRISATLSRIAGAGRTRLSIAYAEAESAFSSSPRTPVGAVIVAEGAGDIAVRLNLIRAAQALLGLPPGAVEVFVSEESAP